jgi:glycosyltransferase involved in cell wall biosynthesis
VDHPADRQPRPQPDIVLVLPDDHDVVSGGNLFNRRLQQALERLAVNHRCATLAATLRAAAPLGDTVFLVDSVLREHLPELLRTRRPGHRVLVLVHYLHSLDPHRRSAATLAAEQWLLSDVDGLVANSVQAATALAELFPGRAILHVPPAPIVLPVVDAAPSGNQALLVGNLIRCKGVLPLLEALDRRLQPDDTFQLRVLGRGDFEPDYADRCVASVARSSRLLRAVHLQAPVAAAAMPAEYAQSGLFVAAADFETFGMAMLEARVFGLPIYALDAPYARQHLQGNQSGELFASYDELAAACLAWSRDATRRRAVRQRAFVARLTNPPTWEQAAHALLAQLRGL